MSLNDDVHMENLNVFGPPPPVAKRVAVVSKYHGVELVDHYNWLRCRDYDNLDPEVLAHLQAENTYTKAMMSHTSKLQENLFNEFMALPDEFLSEAPVPEGRYEYFERRLHGKQYKTLYRRKRKGSSSVEIVLDVNELAAGKKFLELGETHYSDSGNFLAYTTDDNGFRQWTLFVKNLRTGETIGPLAERVTSLVWASDNRTLFYSTENPETKRSDMVFRLTLGRKDPVFLYEEKDELFEAHVGRSRDGKYVFLYSTSYESSEYSYLSSDKPTGNFRLILARQENHRYYVDHFGGDFYIRTNDGAKNFRLAKVPVSNPDKSNWRDFIAHRPEVLIEEVAFFKNHLVVFERSETLVKIRVIDMRNNQSHYVEMPEVQYSVGSPADGDAETFGNFNREFATTELRFRYNSVKTPTTIFSYDLATRKLVVVEKTVIPGFDADQYHVELVHATATDGTAVPILISWKGDLVKDGKRKMYLYGYGAYGMCALWAGHFRMERLSLLNRGVIFACAYIRGGGELGEPWHDGGKMLTKKNTFTDFIDARDFLVDNRYCDPEMVIEGRSAGGLLMGSVLNMRPKLCKAALLGVPFVDVINTMYDKSLPLTAGEFLEWGNPEDKEFFDYMLSYSPYDNIQPRDYPAMLVYTALRDSAVMYWEPAKFVAKMRATKTDSNALLFKILLDGGGHGGMSARSDAFKETAFRFAFILDQLGFRE